MQEKTRRRLLNFGGRRRDNILFQTLPVGAEAGGCGTDLPTAPVRVSYIKYYLHINSNWLVFRGAFHESWRDPVSTVPWNFSEPQMHPLF
jgi:hypothetical protein